MQAFIADKQMSNAVSDKQFFVDVYYAQIPKKALITPVYPKERDAEISSCKNEKVKTEKYYVWKLLELAVKNSFNINFNNLNFEKQSSGKWICDGLSFSLSHSHNAVAVAVSNGMVGLDIELLQPPMNAKTYKKILSALEQVEYENLSGDVATEYLINKWTKKESVFKLNGENAFLPTSIQNPSAHALTVQLGDEKYCIAVSTKNNLIPRSIELVTL